MVIVVFFYLLDSLLAERKDRSILFWKSLPVSDTEVVLSKLATALVVAPVFVLLVSSVTAGAVRRRVVMRFQRLGSRRRADGLGWRRRGSRSRRLSCCCSRPASSGTCRY